MIREYTKADFNEALSLYLDTFINPPFEYTWMNKEKMRAYFEDLEKTPKFKGFLYFEQGNLVGICMGAINDYFLSCSYEIKEILVKREYQGRGAGSGFLEQIEHELTALGVEYISLSTDRNIKAYDFYLKNGFSITESTVSMCKFL